MLLLASTPVVGAMVTLWNDMRFSQGGPALGFLNPWLYQIAADYPETFYDVTVGNIGFFLERHHFMF